LHTLEQLRSGALAGIRRLDLSAGLDHFPSEIFGLADTLEVLNLSGNRLASLPHDLARLHRLKIIFCSDNPFTALPDVLGECQQLRMVGFKACRIAHVPAAALPPQLRWLTLTDNAIAQLPYELGERTALQKLMLAGNRLRALPDSLAQAANLELLRLSANRFETLPTWLTQLARLSWLALAGNPLGWYHTAPPALPTVPWADLVQDGLLGEGASGHIYRVHRRSGGESLALKVFKGAVTSDGLPEHELAASLAAGPHPALTTPCAELSDHPHGARGLLLPLIPEGFVNLAGPPSLDSCTRDVYAGDMHLPASTALQVARRMAEALAHLHQRGVMHGDFYAHNILWHPSTGEALLGDFGAGTLLPSDNAAQARALLALEVRAFGYLLEELVARMAAGSAADGMTLVLQDCLNLVPAQRPAMADVAWRLSRLA
jgi:hypothetical protein